MKELSIIIPVFNEETTLPLFFQEIEKFCNQATLRIELIFVDDGSTDNSLSILKEFSQKYTSIRIISLTRNFGQQLALLAGIHKSQSPCVVLLDSDLQDPPSLINTMYSYIQQGYDIVSAQRTQRNGESFFKKLTANIFYFILTKSTNRDIPANIADFQMIGQKPLAVLKKLKGSNLSLRGLISWMGFKRKIIPYTRNPRIAGTTHYSLAKMQELAINTLTTITHTPLQICLICFLSCLCVSIFLFIAILFLLIQSLPIPLWLEILTPLIFLASIHFLCLSIMSMYLAKIHEFSQEKPSYIINDEKE